jgi:hypothetical protein
MHSRFNIRVALLLDPSILRLCPRRNEEVKWSLEVVLGIVREIDPAIESCGSQSTGRIVEALIRYTERHVLSIHERSIVEFVLLRIVLDVVVLHTVAETIDVFEIGLDVGLPLSLRPGGT